MSLLNKYNNKDTRFLDLKFEGDRPGGASSNEPYLYKNLPYVQRILQDTNIGAGNFPNFNNALQPLNNFDNDGFNRGGATVVSRGLNDGFRIFRKLFDNKNIGGFLFSTKQLTLSRANVLTQASPSIVGFGIAPRPNQGRYNVFKIISQAAGVGLGLHQEKFGRPFLSPGSLGFFRNDPLRNGEVIRNGINIIPSNGAATATELRGQILNNQLSNLPPEPVRYLNVVGPSTFNPTQVQYKTDRYYPTGFSLADAEDAREVYNPKEGSIIDEKTGRRGQVLFNLTGRGTGTKNWESPSTNESLRQIYKDNYDPGFALRGYKFPRGINNKIHQGQGTIFSYEGGPGSVLGIGKTNIKFSTDRQGVPISTDPYYYLPRYMQRGLNPVSAEFRRIFYTGGRGTNTFFEVYTDSVDPYSTGGSSATTRQDFRAYSNQYKVYLRAPISVGRQYGSWASSLNMRNQLGQSESDPGRYFFASNYYKLSDARKRERIRIYRRMLGGSGPNNSALPVIKASSTNLYDSSDSAFTNLYDRDTNYFPFEISLYDPISKEYYVLKFDAFLGDINDSYSNDWGSHNYVGRNETFFKFNGKFERKIGLTWKIVAFSRKHIMPIYTKLNLLASSMAGTYTKAGFPSGVLAKLTIGDLIVDQWGFIKDLGFSYKEGSPWDLPDPMQISHLTDLYNTQRLERLKEPGKPGTLMDVTGLGDDEITGNEIIQNAPKGMEENLAKTIFQDAYIRPENLQPFKSMFEGKTYTERETFLNENADNIYNYYNKVNKLVLRLCKYIEISSFNFQCIHNFRPELDTFNSDAITKPFLFGSKHAQYQEVHSEFLSQYETVYDEKGIVLVNNDLASYRDEIRKTGIISSNYYFQNQDRSAKIERSRQQDALDTTRTVRGRSLRGGNNDSEANAFINSLQ